MNDKEITNKSLSIRISSDGLSFCAYSPTESSPYTYKVYRVRPTISMAANLKEALNSEPMLQEKYQRVNVLVTSPHVTAVPASMFKNEEADTIYAYNFPTDKTHRVSYNVLRRSGIALIFSLEKNVYQLILDDFPRARFYASASTLIEFFGEKSLTGTNKKMFAYLHDGEMTLYAFDQGSLLTVNSYPVHDTKDCQYYILNLWQQLGFDQLDDTLMVVADKEKSNVLVEEIRYFLRDAQIIERSEDFRNTVTNGNMTIPYDLQTLLICGF